MAGSCEADGCGSVTPVSFYCAKHRQRIQTYGVLDKALIQPPIPSDPQPGVGHERVEELRIIRLEQGESGLADFLAALHIGGPMAPTPSAIDLRAGDDAVAPPQDPDPATGRRRSANHRAA